MPIRAVAFDLDGLLVNTEELYELVGGELLGRRGHCLDDRLLSQMIGRPSRVALPLMIEWYGLHDTVAQLEMETDEIFADVLPGKLQPMAGVADLLDWLERRGTPKAVATSSRRSFVQQVLDQLGWQDRFEFVLASEDVVHGKPHPEIYLRAAGQLKVMPRDLMVLEDSENGCRAAVAAGACAVAVPHRRTAMHDFHGVRLIAESVGDPRVLELFAEASARD